MIARDLALPGRGGRHESYYQQVRKIGPAEKLTADEEAVRSGRYWDFDPGRKIRYTSDAEYAEHFKAVFRQAVRDRLRATGPVRLYMSGGLDSTSIAAVAADEMARPSGSLASRLHAITWTFDLTPEADETPFSQAVAQQWGFEYEEWLLDSMWSFFDYPERILHQDEPYVSPWHSYFIAGLGKYGNPEAHVWMTGVDGDSVVGVNNPFYYLNLIRSGRLISFAKEFTSHRRMFNIPGRRLAKDFILGPFLWWPARLRLRSWRRSKRVHMPSWIAPALAQRTNLSDWIQRQPSLRAVASRPGTTQWHDPAKEHRYRLLTDFRTPRLRVWLDRMAAPWGAEVWNPWDDTRLAELVLAIPEEQVAQGINHKLILRRAMKEMLPATVREQRGLRTGPAVFTRKSLHSGNIGAIIDALFAESKAVALGYLDENGVQQAIAEARSNPSALSMSLWLAISLELWLRTFDKRE
jgi:asparagine synthase (glutamine-hydrolysing)